MATRFRRAGVGDFGGFVGGQDFGDYGVDAELVGDAACSRLVVSGQHDDLDVHGVQFAYCRRRGVTWSVRQSENPGRPAVDRHEYSRTPGRGKFISTPAHLTQVNALGCHKPAVAHQHSSTVNFCSGSVTWNVAE
jgi:hypothetical protein